MITTKINLEIYDFKIEVIEVESREDAPAARKALKRLMVSNDLIDEITQAITDGDINGGWTMCNYGIKRIAVVLLPMESETKRRSVLMHEKRHVEDDIMSHCNIDDAEAAGYLAGYLSKFIF